MAGRANASRQISGASDWILGTPTAALSTNSTLDGFSAVQPGPTKPVTDTANGIYIIDLGNAPVLVGLVIAGTDAANETGTVDVMGIHEVRSGDANTACYWPLPLLDLAVTLGALQLSANAGELTTALFIADTITVTNDYTRGELAKVSTVADGTAVVWFDPMGARYLRVETATGTAAGLVPIIIRL